MSDEKTKEEWRKALMGLDLRQILCDTFMDGFDTYEDYEKYGDAFVPLKPKKTEELNAELAKHLDKGSKLSCEACEAVSAFTREKMYRLHHIPNKYYLPTAKPGDLKRLYEELNKVGHIDLDEHGEPACLSGKPAVLSS